MRNRELHFDYFLSINAIIAFIAILFLRLFTLSAVSLPVANRIENEPVRISVAPDAKNIYVPKLIEFPEEIIREIADKSAAPSKEIPPAPQNKPETNPPSIGNDEKDENPNPEGQGGESAVNTDTDNSGNVSSPESAPAITETENGDSVNVDSTGSGTSGSNDNIDLNSIIENYRVNALRIISAHKTYPPTAVRLGVVGEVRVKFKVSDDGMVSDAVVESSSGNASLDSAALNAVKSSSPLPPIPPELGKNFLDLSLLIIFKLN